MTALFSYGFRPFFLLTAGYAVLILPVWWLVLQDILPMPDMDPLSWHAGNMVFGFISAGVAGFVLTAVPSWTGTLPLTGPPLFGLAVLWVSGRVMETALPAWWIGDALELAFIPALVILGLLPILRARMVRNYVLIVIIVAYWCGDVLYRFGPFTWDELETLGIRLGLSAIICLLAMIGGRVVPAFTTAAFERQGRSNPITRLVWVERIILPVTAIAFGIWLMVPDHGFTAITLAFAATLHAIRFFGWHPWLALKDPLLWVLHAAYGWLVIGIFLLAGSAAADYISATTAIHALTVGAITNMLLGIMSRAALGHTGRRLEAPRILVAAYCLLNLSALVRVFAPLVAPSWTSTSIGGAALAWTAGFALFLWIYGPILTSPRADGMPG